MIEQPKVSQQDKVEEDLTEQVDATTGAAQKAGAVRMAGATVLDTLRVGSASHVPPEIRNAIDAEADRRAHGTHVPHVKMKVDSSQSS